MRRRRKSWLVYEEVCLVRTKYPIFSVIKIDDVVYVKISYTDRLCTIIRMGTLVRMGGVDG